MSSFSPSFNDEDECVLSSVFSYFPPRQTPHRLSMLPRQQEFHQFKVRPSELL